MEVLDEQADVPPKECTTKVSMAVAANRWATKSAREKMFFRKSREVILNFQVTELEPTWWANVSDKRISELFKTINYQTIYQTLLDYDEIILQHYLSETWT